jgi:hypothetical protein
MIYGIECKEVPHRCPSHAILDADMLRILLWPLFASTFDDSHPPSARNASGGCDFVHKDRPHWRLAMSNFSYETRSAPLPAAGSPPKEAKVNGRMWDSVVHDEYHWP